jgi:beta-glucosidase
VPPRADVLNDPKSQQAARAAVQSSVVLLRNEQGLLPLDKSGLTIKSIAVIGPLADAEADLLSMWGALPKPGPTVSILQGIKNKVDGAIQVEFAHGPNIQPDILSPFEAIPSAPMKEQPKQSAEEANQAIEDAVALANRSDMAVLVLGEIDPMSGEAASRSSLELSRGQEQLLQAVAAIGKPVALVLVNGRRSTFHGRRGRFCHSGGLVSGKPGRQRRRRCIVRRRKSGRPLARNLAAQQRPSSHLLQPQSSITSG